MTNREREDRLLQGMAELKAEVVALALHVEKQNGSIAKHFAEDLAWQREYADKQLSTKAFRRGLLWPLGLLVTAAGIIGPIVGKAVWG